MKRFTVLLLTFSVVAAEVVKKEERKQSQRTGRQFGWQTPFSLPYSYSQVYSPNYQDSQQSIQLEPQGSKSSVKENSKNGISLQGKPHTGSANKLRPLTESLKLQPLKVNAKLTVAPGFEKPKPVVVPASYSPQIPQYPYQSYYSEPNYYHHPYQHKPIQNFYGKETIPVAPQTPSSETLYETSNPEYIGMGYNTGFGQHIIPVGHPSFGLQGQYIPSGGMLGNYQFNNNINHPLMATASSPMPPNNDINIIEFENITPENFQFECPLDISGNSHVVGQAQIYPDPFTCNRFYYCQMGNAYVFQCSDDLYYNPAIKACDDLQYFSCGNRAL